jgi:hypothetical protein
MTSRPARETAGRAGDGLRGGPLLTTTITECSRTGYYQVNLDDDPFGGDRGMINVPAEVLEIVVDEAVRRPASGL